MHITELKITIAESNGDVAVRLDTRKFNVSAYAKMKLEAVIASFQERQLSDETMLEMRNAIASMIYELTKQGCITPKIMYHLPDSECD